GRSRGSCPARMSSIRAHSSTVRASGPAWSSDQLNGIMPKQLTNPYVGLRPVTPQQAAGMRMEPPVSVPVAIVHIRAARAAAEPPLEPPGTRVRSQGLAVGGLKVPYANSCVFVLPSSTAPALDSFSATAAS